MTDSPHCPSCSRAINADDVFCPKCGASLPGAPTVATAEAPLAPPDLIKLEAILREELAPGFLLVRALGQGGMGSVFLAREPALKRLVAVKVLAPDLARDAASRTRFEREAQAVAGFSHPNVVGIHSVGELPDGTPYFIMQYVGGRSISARIEADGPLDPDEARRILGEVASALAAAHAKGIVHRDIKPANILYDEESGRSLVSDFGIAAVRSQTAATDTRLTATGMLVGTPQYMSPEQLLAEEVSEKTDIYALGLLGYEMLAGRGPFGGTTPQELIAAHLRDVPQKLSEVRPDMDPELDELIAACLNKKAAARPTAADISRRIAPGAGALIEWPPPGLDGLLGRAWNRGNQLWMASLTVTAALLVFVAFGTRLGPVYYSANGVIVMSLAVVGTLGVVVRSITLLADARRGARAVRQGYAWLTIAEVAADSRGDTGHLIAGGREYAGLDPASRGTLRRARVVAALLYLTGALLPLPVFVVVAWLADAGALPAAATPVLALGPALLALAVAAALGRHEQRAVARFRQQFKRRRHGADSVARLVGPWYASFDAVRGAAGLGRGPRGRSRAGLLAAVAAAAVVIGSAITLAPLWAIGSAGAAIWDIALPKFANTLQKYHLAAVALPYAPRPDSSISAQQAGDAFWALLTLVAQHTPDSAFPERPARALNPLPHLDGNDSLFAGLIANGWDGPHETRILEQAQRGFTAAQRAWLEQLAAHPVWAEFSTVARAPAADLLGGRFALPFSDNATWAAMPIPRFAGNKEVAYANGSRAALLMAQGRVAEAEGVLRETIGYGRAMMMNGATLIESLIGIVIVGIGRAQLQTYYDVTGRSEGAALRARWDSVSTAQSTATGGELILGMTDRTSLRLQLAGIVRNPALPRALRLEFAAVLGLAPCTNARELLFGPTPELTRLYDWARDSLARFPSEAALIDLMREAPERQARSALPGLPHNVLSRTGSIAAALLGNSRLAGCTRLVSVINAIM